MSKLVLEGIDDKMAYIIKSLRKLNLVELKKMKSRKKELLQKCTEHEKSENKMFIITVIITGIVITVDFVLVVKFIDIIKNI